MGMIEFDILDIGRCNGSSRTKWHIDHQDALLGCLRYVSVQSDTVRGPLMAGATRAKLRDAWSCSHA
jgi:hypothetical protein